MKIKLLSDELVSVQPMSEKQYKKFLTESEKDLKYRKAVYQQTYIRRVLIEKCKCKHQPNWPYLNLTSLMLYEQ
jgi:hypothetical protein